jgi:tetratricopeptide (TPR) repeat protein
MICGWMMDGFRFARFYALSFALALLFCGTGIELVRAQSLSERLHKAKLLFVEGQKAYVRGDLVDALKSFREAHRLVPSAELAYNIGHISEQLGDFDNAIRFLGLYLSRSLPSAKDRKEIEIRIAGLLDKVRLKREELSRRLRIPSALTELTRKNLKKAVAMTREGRYQTALVLFSIALDQYRRPEIYYSIAMLSEQLGRAQEALTNYQAYLRARAHAADREAVEKKIAELVRSRERRVK